MGSLMGGWNSPVLGDEHKVRLMRNRSLTNEEVETFWRQRGKPAEIIIVTSPLASSSSSSSSSPRVEISPRMERTIRSPATTRVDGEGEAVNSPSTSRDWWTRSSWAFLNEATH